MTNPPLRIIKKKTPSADSTQSITETSPAQQSTADKQFTTDRQAPDLADSDELDLSQIKLPNDFQAKLDQETTSNSVPSRPPIAANWGGSNPYNEMREDFLIDEIQLFSDEEYWDLESDLNFEGEMLSVDYVDFLLSYE